MMRILSMLRRTGRPRRKSGRPFRFHGFAERLEQRVLPSLTPVGPEFLVNTDNQSEQQEAVAMDADGDFVVAWLRSSYDGAGNYLGRDIYARRFDAAGAPLSGDLHVNTSPNYSGGGHSVTNPHVATDATGDFVVVWEHESLIGGVGNDVDMYARRYDATAGDFTGDEFKVNSIATAAAFERNPEVAMDADGDFVVTWQRDYYDIRARRFSSAGAALGDEFIVNTTGTFGTSQPSIAMDDDGDFVIAWQRRYYFGEYDTVTEVRARRFDALGTPAGADFRVNTGAAGEYSDMLPAAAMDRDGDFVITWTQGSDVLARRYVGGAAQGDEFLVHHGGLQFAPRAAMDAAGDFVLAWFNDYEILARQYDSTGAAQGDAERVNTTTTGDQLAPWVAMDDTGRFIVVWYGNGPGDADGVFGQRFDDAFPPSVDIVDVAPDPRGTAVDEITITFSEAVDGFDVADLTLKRGAGGNLLTGSQTLATSDHITWTLGNLAGLTGASGSYSLALAASSAGIADAAGNALAADASDNWTVDIAPPTADIVDVSPDPRNSPVSSVSIVFSEAVSGFNLADLTLKRGGGANLLMGSQTLTTSDSITWTLGNLAGLTNVTGNYTLALVASGSGIADSAGNALTADASDAWAVDATAPTADIVDVTPDPRNSAVSSISIVFSEAVSGFNLADLTLKRGAGGNLLTGSQTLTTGDNITWTLGNLAGLTLQAGNYTILLTASGSGITDAIGNALAGNASDQFTVNADFDGDGIANEIDTAPNSFSSDFSDGITAGTIARRGGFVVSINDLPGTAGVVVATSGSGSSADIDVSFASGSERVSFDKAGETANVTSGPPSPNNGSTKVTAVATPDDIVLRKPSTGVPATVVRLSQGQTATLGSPVTADAGNAGLIRVELDLDEDNENAPAGFFDLEASESADVTFPTPTTVEVSMLSGETTLTIGGQQIDIGQGETGSLPLVVDVGIDILPKKSPNRINLGKKKLIPIALLSTADFAAAADVDEAFLTFGRTGDEQSLKLDKSKTKDVNKDGLPDRVYYARPELTGFTAADTEGVFRGRLRDGTPIEGRDSVQIVPPKNKSPTPARDVHVNATRAETLRTLDAFYGWLGRQVEVRPRLLGKRSGIR